MLYHLQTILAPPIVRKVHGAIHRRATTNALEQTELIPQGLDTAVESTRASVTVGVRSILPGGKQPW